MATLPAAPTALETIVLTRNDCHAFLAPERGGMATRFFVGERPIFYLDESTLLDKTKNVRGGNPILFPSPGKLEGDRFVRGERSGQMGQHGFARNEAWEVISQKADEATLRLTSNDRTRAVYPWDFVVTFHYSLKGSSLHIEQTFESTGAMADPMPFGAGFHPYFHVPQANKGKARVKTLAARAWDNAAKEMVDVPSPIDLTAKEVDLHLIDHDGTTATLELGDGAAIDVRCSKELRRWVVWTLENKDFVCLEPWSCPANALNTDEDLLIAYPGEPIRLHTEIALREAP